MNSPRETDIWDGSPATLVDCRFMVLYRHPPVIIILLLCQENRTHYYYDARPVTTFILVNWFILHDLT